MALRQIRIGSLVDVHQYDDGVYDKSMVVEDPISCLGAPVAPNDVVRLGDLAGFGTGDVVGPAGAVDENVVIFDGITGKKIKDSGVAIANVEDAIGRDYLGAQVFS
ncbi:MAG: hypothetical protein IMZ53_16105 [Thermoplasmata archaeon]|nr:hypothetical protein [Thermoplasmata archaeon]